MAAFSVQITIMLRVHTGFWINVGISLNSVGITLPKGALPGISGILAFLVKLLGVGPGDNK